MRAIHCSLFTFVYFAFFCAGCTNTINVRVVDGDSGEALSGVLAELHSRRSDLLLGFTNETHYLGQTDSHGIVQAKWLHPHWTHDVDLRLSGYSDARLRINIFGKDATVDTPIVLENSKRDAPKALGSRGTYLIIENGRVTAKMYKSEEIF